MKSQEPEKPEKHHPPVGQIIAGAAKIALGQLMAWWLRHWLG